MSLSNLSMCDGKAESRRNLASHHVLQFPTSEWLSSEGWAGRRLNRSVYFRLTSNPSIPMAHLTFSGSCVQFRHTEKCNYSTNCISGRLPWSAEAPSVSFSQCQSYDGDLVGAYVGWITAKKPPNYIPVTPGNSKKYPVRGCDHGWIYNHTFHTLTTEVIN
jgi:hypothetical protein